MENILGGISFIILGVSLAVFHKRASEVTHIFWYKLTTLSINNRYLKYYYLIFGIVFSVAGLLMILSYLTA